MKTLACVVMFVAALLRSPAYAGSEIQLPSPLVFNYYTNPYCHYNPPAWTAASGFTADGNYLNGISQGYVACGHSGRVGGLHYTYYCLLDVWDLSGNLISVTVHDSATCPSKATASSQTWTNPLNPAYQAYTVTNVYYGYIQSQYAVLDTP
jgi:hypothetical protein